MNVVVVGSGYVGLTSGVALAYIGHRVVCVDQDEAKVELLRAGRLPIHEPGLEELLGQVGARLRFTCALEEAMRGAELIMLAVGTPASADGSPDLTHLHAAAAEVLGHLAASGQAAVLINKSTAPVGTADRIREMARRLGVAGRVAVGTNPEFLRQGHALQDTLYPERLVAGGDAQAVAMMRTLYAPLLEQRFTPPAHLPRPAQRGEVPLLTADARSAELAKYAANAFLAMKISFINEIANVCDRVGADVQTVAGIIGADRRIGGAFLQAGIGYGGSCFPKDTRALRSIADTSGYDFKLLSAVIEVNNAQKFRLVELLHRRLGSLQGKPVAVLGLTFKPGTDDLREAPSLPVIAALAAAGAQVTAHDPVAAAKAAPLLPPGVRLAESAEAALRG
ncbi:UDP-glucose/GDP-mannose dehydrogenase family protein, partial [Paenibacillus sp. IB182496]